MKSSISNRIAGEVHEVKGTIKQKIGQLTNDRETETKGLAEKVAGKIQKKVGQVQKAVTKR